MFWHPKVAKRVPPDVLESKMHLKSAQCAPRAHTKVSLDSLCVRTVHQGHLTPTPIVTFALRVRLGGSQMCQAD